MSDDLKILAEDLIDFCNAEEANYVRLRKQIEKLLGSSGTKASLPESTFNVLRFVEEKGSKLGIFECAYKAQNLPEKWNHCWNILKANNAVIVSSFCCEGYVHRYWIFPDKFDDRIFRKRLEAKP